METPVIAKKIVEHYSKKAPTKSYYSGGSCGGKEGQISAQKFPWLYDGFFIGYPLGGHLQGHLGYAPGCGFVQTGGSIVHRFRL